MLSGCTSLDWAKKGTQNSVVMESSKQSTHSLHGHVEQLVRQLFSTSQPFDTSLTVAVGTILPSLPPNGVALPEQSALGIQIQESIMTFATQAGLKVIEYKTMPSIKIGHTADSMLSRNVKDLTESAVIDYFLTGTYTLQENSTIVNLRLIHVPENIVLAAATDYIPNNTMWSQSKITIKNNHLYRNEY